jgi:hypothetical protein
VDSSELEKIQIQQWILWLQMLERAAAPSCSTVTMEEQSVRPMIRPFSKHSFVYSQYTYTISLADSLALLEQDATLANNLLGLFSFE